ncbi:MAG TPA: 30S ribosomal protein S20 [Myxococcaceae bacterium]|nr:30S ribosomal protein S20 [Myxococcaceae bacterium]
MANTKSAEKRSRQNLKRRARNQAVRTQVKSALKRAREALSGKDAKAAEEAVREAVRTLSGAASKGVLHPRNAARRISRLARSAASRRA